MKENIKAQLYKKCMSLIAHKLEVVRKQMQDLEDDFLSETKSSAGDKHETGRAMMHLEREKIGKQFSELNQLNEVLAKIGPNIMTTRIGLGSVVLTSEANYFISVSIGLIKLPERMYYAISSVSPIGKLLLGKVKGEVVFFREKEIKILDVY